MTLYENNNNVNSKYRILFTALETTISRSDKEAWCGNYNIQPAYINEVMLKCEGRALLKDIF